MKIKNFNIPDFGRIFLGKKKEGELVTYKNIKHSFNISTDKFDEEDKEVLFITPQGSACNGCEVSRSAKPIMLRASTTVVGLRKIRGRRQK